MQRYGVHVFYRSGAFATKSFISKEVLTSGDYALTQIGMSNTNRYESSIDIGGRTLTLSSGDFAHQANGAVVAQYGETVVLATATMSEPRDGVHFFPLMVDFEERLYAGGKIKGSRFMKREGRPSDDAVTVARLIDRALRPLFPQHVRNDIQVVITVLAYDHENEPDVLGLIAAQAALAISDIPMNGMCAAVRVGNIGGEWVLNPTVNAMKKSSLDLLFAATEEKTLMIECQAHEVSEQDVQDALIFGRKHARAVLQQITHMQSEIGKEKRIIESEPLSEEMLARLKEDAAPVFDEILFAKAKDDRKGALKRYIKKTVQERTQEDDALDGAKIADALYAMAERYISDKILSTDSRPGGRSLTEIRALRSRVHVLPRVHGSAEFMRGETQVLSTVTLGAPGDQQIVDGMREEYKKSYFHHYNFPPYSVGETQPLRGPSRRDIGHGMLAEKAIIPVLPDRESFPYTIRTMSEVFGSNGSSSMASTCGCSLALMDAGVPIKRAVAGIAMGLVSNDRGDWKVLTDLQDLEDSEGGMDFKIAGTSEGITAIQLDTKTLGLSDDIVAQTLSQGREARMEILASMAEAIKEPRADLSPYAPRIITIKIPVDEIGTVIGPAGKQINEIIEQTAVDAIDIEEDGTIFITARNEAGASKAKQWIEDLTRQVTVGEEFRGKVVKLMDFGAFVEFLPGKEGMIHASKLAPGYVQHVADVIQVDDEVEVKLIEIDSMGRFNLALMSKNGTPFEKIEVPGGGERPPRRDQGRDQRKGRGPRHSAGQRSTSRDGGSRDGQRRGQEQRGFFKKHKDDAPLRSADEGTDQSTGFKDSLF